MVVILEVLLGHLWTIHLCRFLRAGVLKTMMTQSGTLPHLRLSRADHEASHDHGPFPDNKKETRDILVNSRCSHQ